MKFTGERMIPDYNKEKRIYLEHISRYYFIAKDVKNKQVCDLACGSGYGSFLLAKNGAEKVTGIDISKEAVDFCLKKYKRQNLNFKEGNATKIPLETKSIDLLVSFETIEHITGKDQKKFLEEIKRVLKKNGRLIISTPNTMVYPKGNPYHIRELKPLEFLKLLKKYFPKIDLYFQGCVEGSYILPKNTLKNEIENDIPSLYFNKINTINPILNSPYLIAVCSFDTTDKPIAGSFCMSSLSIDYDDAYRFIESLKFSRYWGMIKILVKFKRKLKSFFKS